MIPLSLPDRPLRVACLAAHPDDIEIACGGALLTLDLTHHLTAAWLTLTGSAARVQEATEAASAFVPGASATFHDLPDGWLPEHWGRVKDALHAFSKEFEDPDVVLAPRPDDAHQDHRLLGDLAPKVWRNALVLQYEVPKWDGDMCRPTTYVAVPEELAHRKFDLLDKYYTSQHGKDWWDRDLFLGFMRVRGMECRATYAEAFTVTKSLLV
jgi:LmbE family N-acetylglucosaminyl deacetylase